VNTDKYKLTDEQLKQLLLVSSVKRRVLVPPEESDDETSKSIERQTSEKTIQLSKDDKV
jgi:hypothetical protein